MSDAPFRYVVTVRLRADIGADRREALLTALDATMASGPLPYRFEPGLKLQPGAADFSMSIDFRSAAELAAWNAPSIEHAGMKRLTAEVAEQAMVLCHALAPPDDPPRSRS